MSTIVPELMSVFAIKVIKSNIFSTDEYTDKPVKPEEVEVKLHQESAFDYTNKNARIRLTIMLVGKDKDDNNIGLNGEFGIEFQLHVDNLDTFVVEKEGQKIIDKKLGGTLLGIVYSSARGIVFERTNSTFFGGVILPVINPNTLIET